MSESDKRKQDAGSPMHRIGEGLSGAFEASEHLYDHRGWAPTFSPRETLYYNANSARDEVSFQRSERQRCENCGRNASFLNSGEQSNDDRWVFSCGSCYRSNIYAIPLSKICYDCDGLNWAIQLSAKPWLDASINSFRDALLRLFPNNKAIIALGR